MKRADIQTMLEEFQQAFSEDSHVYFQPPDSAKLVYPCFVYTYSDININYANDQAYLKSEEYIVKYITKKADPPMLDSLIALNMFRFDRHYTSDNLHHYSFVLLTPFVSITPQIDLSTISNKYI